jgi:RimK family alpha-L-glutamate ligase
MLYIYSMKTVWILSKKGTEVYENQRLVETFANSNITADIVNADEFDLIVNKNNLTDVWRKGQLATLPDAVLVRTGSGSNYFALAVLRQLESLGVPVINSSTSITLVKDKLETMQILAKNSIAIPKTMLVRWPINEKLVDTEIGYPCVVKVITGSGGKGVYLCNDNVSFTKLMQLVKNLDTKKTMIIQEYIGHRVGTDLRVIVVGGKVIGAMQRHSDNDFRANITNGGHGASHEVTAEIEYIARETARIMNLDIAGIDLLFDQDGFKVCEANSSPGFRGFEQYCPENIAQAMVDYIAFRIS